MKWHKATIKIALTTWGPDGLEKIDYLETEALVKDGLAVNLRMGPVYGPHHWTITHVKSGYSLGRYCRTQREAKAAVERALTVTNWNRSEAALAKLKTIGERTRRALNAA